MQSVTSQARFRPYHGRARALPFELVSAMAEEAEHALAADGYIHNGTWNAAPGDAAVRFIDHVDVAAVVAESTGLKVEPPRTGAYIAYLDDGQSLDFHLDKPAFAEASMILCVKHDRAPDTSGSSATTMISADGYQEYPMEAGDFVIFDDSRTGAGDRRTVAMVHARSPSPTARLLLLEYIGGGYP